MSLKRLIDVSVVAFAPQPQILSNTLASLASALADVPSDKACIFLVDNGPGRNEELLRESADPLIRKGFRVEIISGHGNVGYGSGHDLAFNRAKATYHLILNPDVIMEPNAIRVGLDFLQSHASAVLLVPRILSPTGEFQSSCKRLPGVLTLLLRGFAPASIRAPFRDRLKRYEMLDVIGPGTEEPVFDIPLASGCFMLVRSKALKEAGGFGDSYFLYFEDFDLSIRLGRIGKVVFLPQMRIVHAGGEAARKGLKHVAYFVRASVTFFNRNGWRL